MQSTALTGTIDWNGRIETHYVEPIGFLHYGIVADCERCGKMIDATDMDLPVLEPDFNPVKE